MSGVTIALGWFALGVLGGAYGLLRVIEYGRSHWGGYDPRR